MPPAMAAPGPGLPPHTCWRCGAALYPGYPLCTNCGLDLRMPWMPPVQRRRSRLPIFVAIAAVVLLAAVGAVVVLNRSNGWDPGVEPSPSDTWSAFAPADGSWSVMFPGSATPRTMTQTMDTGFGTMAMNLYMTTDGGAVYEAAAEDLPGTALSGDSGSMLTQAEQGIGVFGKVTASRDLVFKTYNAREVKFTYTSMSFDGYARFWIAGQRMYMLMAIAKPGTTMYPEHFFDSFNMD